MEECIPVACYQDCLIDVVGFCVKELRFPACVVLGISLDDAADGHRMLSAELFGGPAGKIVWKIAGIVAVRIPGIVQEKGDGKFHRFEVADIDDPYLSYAVVISQVHL